MNMTARKPASRGRVTAPLQTPTTQSPCAREGTASKKLHQQEGVTGCGRSRRIRDPRRHPNTKEADPTAPGKQNGGEVRITTAIGKAVGNIGAGLTNRIVGVPNGEVGHLLANKVRTGGRVLGRADK